MPVYNSYDELYSGLIANLPGAIWAHAIRTLTNQGVSVTSPASGDPLEVYRDTTVYIALTGLGALSGYTKLWFTIKEDLEDLDTEAILQIEAAAGLLYIDGKAGVSTDGVLTVQDAATGSVLITLKQASAALLPVYAAYAIPWDIKILKDSVVTILEEGTIYIKSTPTRTIT